MEKNNTFFDFNVDFNFIDIPSYISLIAQHLNSNYFYFLKKIEDINKILKINKTRENEFEWKIQKLESRIYELESILIKNQSNGSIVFIKDKKFKKYQEIYIKKD